MAIYALLVGINDYSQNGASNLKGCVRDINEYASLLEELYTDDLQLCSLIDNKATKQNIITHFREHLGQAGEKDVVLFAYAGHGYRSAANEAFNAFQPDGYDEGLVCFDNYSVLTQGTTDFHSLADKDMALLIKELETVKPGQKAPPQIVFILDSCHSGSSTRDTESLEGIETRSWDGPAQETSPERAVSAMVDPKRTKRQLSDYITSPLLQFSYTAKEIKKPTFDVPRAKHILLAACERGQKAKESSKPSGGKFRQGHFSATLQEVLRQSKHNMGDVSYANLFERVRNKMRKWEGQDPQFETFEGFNSHSQFLGHKITNHNRHYVFFDTAKKSWYVKQGALTNIDTSTTLSLLDQSTPQKDSSTTEITEVHLDRSFFELPPELKETSQKHIEEQIRAQVTKVPFPREFVYTDGDPQGVKAIHDAAKDSPFVSTVEDSLDKARYKLIAADGTIQLIRVLDGVVIKRTESYEHAPELVESVLHEIIQWERTLSLENQQAKNMSFMDFYLEIPKYTYGESRHYVIEPGLSSSGAPSSGNQNSITKKEGAVLPYYAPLDCIPTEKKARPYDVPFQFRVQNNYNEKLFAMLLYFNSTYKIASRANEEIPQGTSKVLYTSPYGFILNKNVRQETISYKLIVTREKADHQYIERAGFKTLGDIFPPDDGTRGELMMEAEEKNERQGTDGESIHPNWFTKTCTIKLIRGE